VEDGEAGEATLLHVRAKLFALASKESGWKERGVGTLKINAPHASVSFDEDGQVIPGSYDPSTLEDNEQGADSPKVPRLIMRQENTHRVILNTALLKHMVFKDKPGTSSAQLYFTAIEGDKDPKPISMLLKVISQAC
jgi:DEAD/DEAH box helicase domain-containing protein